MARAIHRLSAPTINNKKEPGYYADGGNLYLRIAPGGTKGWIFRFALDGKLAMQVSVPIRPSASRWRERKRIVGGSSLRKASIPSRCARRSSKQRVLML